MVLVTDFESEVKKSIMEIDKIKLKLQEDEEIKKKHDEEGNLVLLNHIRIMFIVDCVCVSTLSRD